MVYVSKKKIAKDIEKALSDQLLTFLAEAHSKKEAAVLVSELFTEAERMMFAKRLAVIVMLERRYSFRSIQNLLKVTPDTVMRLWRNRKEGKYKKVSRYAREYTSHFRTKSRFLETLGELLTIHGTYKIKNRLLSKRLDA